MSRTTRVRSSASRLHCCSRSTEVFRPLDGTKRWRSRWWPGDAPGRDGGAFLFRTALFGNVLMGGNPTAPGQWFVLGEHDTAAVCLNVVLLTLALCYPVEDFLHVAVDIAGKQTGRLAIFDQFFDRAAWLHDRGIKFVHFQIARIEQGDAALRVEHVQTLRHVVERGGKPTILLEQPTIESAEQHESRNA